MSPKTNPKLQRFDDGRLEVYRWHNHAPPGEYPERVLILRYTLPYQERTVGMQRYWTAHESKVRISHLLRCPLPPDTDGYLRPVSTEDVVMLRDGQQYTIRQIQYPEDIVPRVMDLTLEVAAQRHEVHSDD